MTRQTEGSTQEVEVKKEKVVKKGKIVKGKTVKKDNMKADKLTKELIKLHHTYRGKQRSPEAKQLRRKLRKLGYYLSQNGHHSGLHD